VPLTLDACVEVISRRVPRAPWCGWSLGGLIALQAAVTLPAQVPMLAMLCASPRFVRGADWKYGVSAEIFRDFATGLRSDYRRTLDRFVALEAFGSEHAKDEIRALRNTLFARGEPAARVLADGLELLQTTDLRAMLPALSVPSLWLGGRRDRLVDPPNAEFHVIEHAGHAPFLTHADAVTTRLAEFFGHHSREGGNSVTSALLPTTKALDNSLRSPSGSSVSDDLRTARLSRLRGNDEQNDEP